MWEQMGVSAADVEAALPLLEVLGYDARKVEEFHQDARTLGADEVMRALPADVGLRPKAAFRRLLDKVVLGRSPFLGNSS